MTPRDLARTADLGENTVYRYLSGERPNPGAESIVALAKALRVTTDELLGLESPGEERGYGLGMESVAELVPVPLVGPASAAEGNFAEDRIEHTQLIPKSSLPQGHEDACFLIEAHGEAMIDAGIADGDQVLVCKTLPVTDGDIAVLKVNGEIVVKRVYRRKGQLQLVSDDSGYQPRDVDEGSLVGVIVWCWRVLKG